MENMEGHLEYSHTEDKLIQASNRVRCKQAKISVVTSMAAVLTGFNVDAFADSVVGPIMVAAGIAAGFTNIYLLKKYSTK
ncbi:hypothetical protein [Enterococcus sp. AZ072]|uniref:hypothetical protein n=1 Tax=unclassified Enterococcus TaxID=2608891 RepID=UPI003D293861